MPTKSKKAVKKHDWKGWLLIGLLAFSAGTSAYLLVKDGQSEELNCRIKIADPVTGIIILQCER
jgi:hypothetical protein